MKRILFALVLLLSLTSRAAADPPLGPSQTNTDGTTTCNNVHTFKSVSGASLACSGSTAQWTFTGAAQNITINTTSPLGGGGTGITFTLTCTTCITSTTTLGGDLTGNLPSPTVDGFGGRPFNTGAPTGNDVITWTTNSGGQWTHSGLTIATTAPLTGGAAQTLSWTLACPTCLINGANTVTTPSFTSSAASGNDVLTLNTTTSWSSGNLLRIENNGVDRFLFDSGGNIRTIVDSAFAKSDLSQYIAFHWQTNPTLGSIYLFKVGLLPCTAATCGTNEDLVLPIGSSTERFTDVWSRHFETASTGPSAAAGVAAGTGPTITITGDDAGGLISVTAGSGATAPGVIVTLTFNTAYTTNAFCTFSAANAPASGFNNVTYLTLSKSSLVLNLGGVTGLTNTTVYLWSYTCIGN